MRRVGLLVLGACTTVAPQRIVDSSGAPFELEADGTINMVDGTPEPVPCRAGERALYAWSLGRFVTISSACADDDGWTSAANRERPLACSVIEDCPQWQSWSFGCRNGLCQNADTSRFLPSFVSWSMANELCYAPFPRADTIDWFGPAALAVSDAVMTACPDGPASRGCTQPLPSICWQP
jgi:hypothetical protein